MKYRLISKLKDSFAQIPWWLKIISIGCFLIGTWFRVEGLAVDGYFFDMVETQFEWGKEAWERGIIGFWQTYEGHYDYPVISLLYEYVLYGATHMFNSDGQDPWRLFVAIHKVLNWVIEIAGITWFGYLAKKHASTSTKTIFLVGSLIYALPAIWFVSGIWGQNDFLMAMLALSSIYLFFKGSSEQLDLSAEQVSILKDYRFWSGVVWSCSLFVKQQTLLLAPLFVLLFILRTPKRRIWQAIAYSLPVVGVYGSAVYVYASGGLRNSAIMVGIYMTASLIITFIKAKGLGYWQQLFRFLTGWLSVTWLCSIPWMFIDFMRLARVNFAFAIRGDSISSGAPNVWVQFTDRTLATQQVLDTTWSPSIKIAAYVLFLVLIVSILIIVFNIRIPKFLTGTKEALLSSKQIVLSDGVFLLTLINTLYYFLIPGGHSRYLHIGLVSWVLFFLLKKVSLKIWLLPWLVLSVGYLYNQLTTYFAVSSHEPRWMKDLMDSISVNFDYWGGTLMLVSSIALVSIAVGVYIKRSGYSSSLSSSSSSSS